MAELLIVSMLEPYTLNKPFTVWPRHVTIMPWFNTEIDVVQNILTDLTSKVSGIVFKIGDDALFANGKTAVQLIEDSREINELHICLLQTLLSSGITVDGRFTGELFRPHITVKRGERLPKGVTLELQAVQIAESLPQGYRRIISEFLLKGATNES